MSKCSECKEEIGHLTTCTVTPMQLRVRVDFNVTVNAKTYEEAYKRVRAGIELHTNESLKLIGKRKINTIIQIVQIHEGTK